MLTTHHDGHLWEAFSNGPNDHHNHRPFMSEDSTDTYHLCLLVDTIYDVVDPETDQEPFKRAGRFFVK